MLLLGSKRLLGRKRLLGSKRLLGRKRWLGSERLLLLGNERLLGSERLLLLLLRLGHQRCRLRDRLRDRLGWRGRARLGKEVLADGGPVDGVFAKTRSCPPTQGSH